MRNFMLLITAFLLVGLPALAAAQAPAPDNDKPQGDSRPTEIADEVTRLVRQLDDRELAKRQEAEQQLIALGADVLPLLPPPNNRMPAEMRQRLARIAGALEEAAARAVTESSKVTLSGTLPLAEAMAALEQQTGNHAVGYDQRDAEVTLDLNNVPYWQALDHILDQAQLNIDAYGGQPQTLVLMPRGPNELSRSQYADYHESFRVAAVRVLATRDFVNPAVQGMRISIAAAWEPRLAPISITQLLDKIEARDDQGNAITTDDTTGRREAPVHPGMSAVELELPLALPPRGAEKIATLKGELAVLVPGRVETFEFGGRLAEARNVEQRRAGVTVVLEEIRKNVDLHQIRVRIRFDEAAEALESHRGWIFNNEAYLLDAQGQRVDNVGLETTRQQRNEVGVAYLFDAPQGLAGHKFVYKTPALIIQMAVPYALKDLPLP